MQPEQLQPPDGRRGCGCVMRTARRHVTAVVVFLRLSTHWWLIVAALQMNLKGVESFVQLPAHPSRRFMVGANLKIISQYCNEKRRTMHDENILLVAAAAFVSGNITARVQGEEKARKSKRVFPGNMKYNTAAYD